jgi:hypothetical protein
VEKCARYLDRGIHIKHFSHEKSFRLAAFA